MFLCSAVKIREQKTEGWIFKSLIHLIMIKFYLINGVPTPVESAVLHVSDLSILRGYGIFDFFLAREGHPLFWEDYAARFYRSAQLAGLEVPVPEPALKAQVHELLRINELPDAGVRFVLTGGYSPDAYTPAVPNLLLMLHELPANVWETSATGIKVITRDFQRDFPEVKHINYVMGIRMLPAVKAAGAQDLVYHHGGWIRESARSNFYLVNREGAIVTPDTQILEGVTRKQIITLAREHGIPVEIREVHIQEIAEAAEAFFTSSTKGVMPVCQVDDAPVGAGVPGPVAMRLQALFLAHVRAYLDAQREK